MYGFCFVTLLAFDTAICGKIGGGTVSAGTDQTSNKPGKIDRTETPTERVPSNQCKGSPAHDAPIAVLPARHGRDVPCPQPARDTARKYAWVGGRNMFVGPCASGAAVGAKGH